MWVLKLENCYLRSIEGLIGIVFFHVSEQVIVLAGVHAETTNTCTNHASEKV